MTDLRPADTVHWWSTQAEQRWHRPSQVKVFGASLHLLNTSNSQINILLCSGSLLPNNVQETFTFFVVLTKQQRPLTELPRSSCPAGGFKAITILKDQQALLQEFVPAGLPDFARTMPLANPKNVRSSCCWDLHRNDVYAQNVARSVLVSDKD